MSWSFLTETTELRNEFQFGHRCPTHFLLAYAIKFLSLVGTFRSTRGAWNPDECNFHSTVKHARKIVRSRVNLPINLRRNVIKVSIEKEGDFVTGNASGWFELDLNMLAGKEFDDVVSNESWPAAMPELEPIPQFGGFRYMHSFM